MQAAGAMKMWKTKKQVSHIFTAPWKTRSRKKRGLEFPTAYTGHSIGICSSSGQGRPNPLGLRGEYPIEAWHGVNQCLSLSEEITPTESRAFRFGAATERIVRGSTIRTVALQMSKRKGMEEICLDI